MVFKKIWNRYICRDGTLHALFIALLICDILYSEYRLWRFELSDVRLVREYDKTRLNSGVNGLQGAAPRPVACVVCTLPDFSLLIDGREICRTRDLNAVFLVASAVDNLQQRAAIRRTWAAPSVSGYLKMAVVFFVGVSRDDDAEMRRLRAENGVHGDVIHTAFPDSYDTLSVKRAVSMRWASDFCRHARYVILTDDDVFFNVFALHHGIHNGQFEQPMTIYGKCFGSGFPHRNPLSRWYSPYRVYPYVYYGPFCIGLARLLSNETNLLLAELTRYVASYHLEDVYSTSLLPGTLGVHHATLPGIVSSEAAGNHDNTTVLATLLDNTPAVYRKWQQVMRAVEAETAQL